MYETVSTYTSKDSKVCIRLGQTDLRKFKMKLSRRDVENMKGVGAGVIGCLVSAGLVSELYRSGKLTGVLNSLKFLSPQNSGGVWRASQALTGFGVCYASLSKLKHYNNTEPTDAGFTIGIKGIFELSTGTINSDFAIGVKNVVLINTAICGAAYSVYWSCSKLFEK